MPDEPTEEVIVTVTITEEDNREIRKLYRGMADDNRQKITTAIKSRNKDLYGRRYSDMLAIMAVFVKFSPSQSRDKKLLKDIFSLDDTDLAFLIGELAPTDGSRQVTCATEPDDQPSLFPMTEEEKAQEESGKKTIDTAKSILKSISQKQGKILIAKFAKLAQGAGYNAFQYATEKNSDVREDHARKEMTIERRSKAGLKITLTNYTELVTRWRPSARKILEYANIKLTAQNHFPAGFPTDQTGIIDPKKDNPNINRFVSFTLEEWQEAQGTPLTKKSEDHARERVKADLQTMLYTTLEWEEVSKRTLKKRKPITVTNPDGTTTEIQPPIPPRRRRHWAGVNLVTKAELDDNQITIAFSPEMANYLLNSYITQYPTGLLTIDDRNPNAYAIGRKLAEHYYNEANQRHDRNGILSVAALLDCTDIPTPEYVKANFKGEYIRRIITPFMSAMKATEKAIGLQWQFSNAGGEPLRKDQQPETRIADFSAAYILYSMPAGETKKVPTPPTRDESIK